MMCLSRVAGILLLPRGNHEKDAESLIGLFFNRSVTCFSEILAPTSGLQTMTRSSRVSISFNTPLSATSTVTTLEPLS
jgi:hypothetical protein